MSEMSDEARELQLYIENDGQLYRQQQTPIHKNLATKMARGIYDKDKAVKLWLYLMEAGAKKYAKGAGTPWNLMFPKSARIEAAKAFNEHFLGEYGLGNYNRLLPKKYQPKTAGGGKRRHAGKGVAVKSHKRAAKPKPAKKSKVAAHARLWPDVLPETPKKKAPKKAKLAAKKSRKPSSLGGLVASINRLTQ